MEDVALMRPSANLHAYAAYRGAVPPVHFAGHSYFQRKDDGSIWRIDSGKTISQVEGVPAGAQLYTFGDELYFRVDTPEGQEYYRLENGRIVKALESIKLRR